MTIIEFLEARITEDEQQAESCNFLGWFPGKKYGVTAVSYERVLAECAAKRAILTAASDYSPELEHGDNGEWAFDITLCNLATVYADHPDYQQEWGA